MGSSVPVDAKAKEKVMRKRLILAVVALPLVGCSTFTTKQLDESNAETGLRKITTTVKVRTFWDSKSELARLKATSTDKSQTVGVGSFNGEAHATNAVLAIEGVVRAAVEAAVKFGGKP